MSYALSLYFETLFQERRRHEGEQSGDVRLFSAELIVDNARLPSPSLGQDHPFMLMVGSGSEVLDSCHTRSTISTCTSTLSAHSTQSICSAGSTGSNGSAGSCRWDSNPTSSKENKSKAAMLLNRPKRPGRKASDNCKLRSPKQRVEIEVPQLLETSPPQRVKNKCDKPQRPSRTSSNGSTSSTTSSNASSNHTERRSNHRPQHHNNNKVLSMDNASHDPLSSLDKMLLHSKKLSVTNSRSLGTQGSPLDVDSSSDRSLNEIFRSASHQRRSESPSNSPLQPARSPPTRTVNEILGKSMEELQMSW